MAIIKEQEDIVNERNKNIIVSASAGSGKTTVMIRRIVELVIKDNVKVDELLVLTYTKMAAGEMKQKLLNKMAEKIDENKNLCEEIENINNADISTFDSFCQKLTKKYFYVLGIDPSFSIVSGSEESSLKQKAIKRAIEIFKNDSKDKYISLLDFFGGHRTENDIKNMVFKIFDFSLSILDYEDWKNKSRLLFSENPNKATKIVTENLYKKLDFISKNLDVLMNKSNELEIPSYVEYINKLQSLIFNLKNRKDFGDMLNEFENLEIPRVAGMNKEKDIFNIQPKIKNYRAIFADIKKEFSFYGNKNCYDDSLVQCKQTVENLFSLCDVFISCYKQVKKRRNVYDYNDIERMVIEILSKNDNIRESIKNKYKYIFVDEFQDANLIQETIINLIKKENNVFYVGDLKQAIYGFRQSNPDIFERIAKTFNTDKNSKYYQLNCNFRSNPKVLNFINKIFNSLMTEETAHLNYLEDAQLDGKQDYKQEKLESVELCVLYNENKDNEDKNITYYSVKNAEQDQVVEDEKYAIYEARYIANKINELKCSQIYDPTIKAYREVRYQDITILLRKRGTYQTLLLEELTKLGIPVVENDNKKLDETYDAKVLTDLIYISKNYKDDYRLTSVMLSDLFNFTYQDLSDIRMKYPDKEFFYECVLEYKNQNDKLSNKIDYMFNLIDKFSEDCQYMGLVYALEKILIETSYIYKIKHDFNNKDREQNVKNFVYSFASSSFEFDVMDFLSFREQEEREQKNLLPTKQKDIVGITTMHSSKGLEYPIVFVANLGDNFNKTPDKAEVKLNKELGVGVKYFNKDERIKYRSVFFDAIDKTNKEEELSEKIRLLYVALTRAKNKLYLVGTKNSLEFSKINNSYDVMYKGDYLSQIVGSLEEEDIEKLQNKKSGYLYNNKDYILNVINTNNLKIQNEEKTEVLENNINNKEVEELSKYLLKQYKYKTATTIAQKNSVSALSMDDEHASNNYAPKKLKLDEHSPVVKQNEIGSLYHKILEEIDFDGANITTLNKVIEDIKRQKLFNEEAFLKIDKSIILKDIKTLTAFTKNATLLKEQKFIMQESCKELLGEDIDDTTLVQGVCDLIVIDDKNKVTIIDYKYTAFDDDYLVNRYKKQLYLYKMAIQDALNTSEINLKILNIKSGNLIEL